MCGIVAAIAQRNIVPMLIEGLRRLEYRGYDSAGVAVINGSLKRIRSCGRVAELKKLTDRHQLEGTIGDSSPAAGSRIRCTPGSP